MKDRDLLAFSVALTRYSFSYTGPSRICCGCCFIYWLRSQGISLSIPPISICLTVSVYLSLPLSVSCTHDPKWPFGRTHLSRDGDMERRRQIDESYQTVVAILVQLKTLKRILVWWYMPSNLSLRIKHTCRWSAWTLEVMNLMAKWRKSDPSKMGTS